jgi:hypothetical protein
MHMTFCSRLTNKGWPFFLYYNYMYLKLFTFAFGRMLNKINANDAR